MDHWGVDDVAAWLELLGLGHYSNAFVAYGVNGHLLREGITDEDLLELGLCR